jgi:hypothetical protein
MSALGQKPTLAPQKVISALRPIATVKADISRAKMTPNKAPAGGVTHNSLNLAVLVD